MRRILLCLLCLPPVALVLSCGSSAPTSTSVSGVQYRAFVSQDVSSPQVLAGLEIIDAQHDLRAGVPPIQAGATPGMMVVTPNHNVTLVFSAADNTLSLIANASETNAAHITLPGQTESIVVTPDSHTAFVAVPTAFAGLQLPPGVVYVVNINSASVVATLPVPAARYLAINSTGSRVLAFSDSSQYFDSVFVITPTNIGTNTNPVSQVIGFDKPVTASFSNDGGTAYVVNCGAECGGTQASVETLDLTSNAAGSPVPVSAATVAVVNGTTMYLAGTPVPASPCTGQQTQATTCGELTVFDLTSMSVTNASPIIITDGYHNRMALGANGQLFVGARTCTEIIPPNPPPQGAEIRGCLSIYNTQSGAVVIPPANGDVTGIQPIAKRNVVYLVQNGELRIYDTTTDKLQPSQIDISGNAVDVKTIDF